MIDSPRGPRIPSPGGGRPQSSSEQSVFGVGSRVLVTSHNGGVDGVTLTDEGGTRAIGSVSLGIEVEIVAWRPRRSAETRYRVVATKEGIDGWLSATNLRMRPAPPPVKRIEVSESVPRSSPTRPTAAAPRATRTVVPDRVKATRTDSARGTVAGRRGGNEPR